MSDSDSQNPAPNLAEEVARAQAGDARALSSLVRQTQDRLFRFCLHLCSNQALAQDLCQDTYVRALEKLGKLKDPAKLMSWLFIVAKNVYLDHLKSPRNAEADPLHEVEERLLWEKPADGDLALQIRQAMEGMKPQDRLILLLVDLEEHSYAEAAEIVGISESSLRFKLHHIRKAFAAKYGK